LKKKWIKNFFIKKNNYKNNNKKKKKKILNCLIDVNKTQELNNIYVFLIFKIQMKFFRLKYRDNKVKYNLFEIKSNKNYLN
jgi:hypothetical protein